MPLCAVATRMRGYQQLLLWPLACASSIGISPRQSSGRGGSVKPRGAPGFTSEHCGGIIDPRTHRTLDYAHIQVRDLMNLPGRVEVGQPGTVTGESGGNS
jgi:hypothetical protein